MSTIAERPVSPLTFWLVLSAVVTLVLTGIGLRVVREDLSPAAYIDGETERHFTRFLATTGLPDTRWVHYTRDGGIRGLQTALPECGGYLQMTVMPEGDEFLGLWATRAQASDYKTAYLFRGQLYDHFPTTLFWAHTMAHSLTRRLHITNDNAPGPVLAMAYPKGCATVMMIKWYLFNL